MTNKASSGRSKRGPAPHTFPRTRARWTSQEASRVLEDWLRSGLSLSAFAREQGLNQQRLFWWRSRLRESQTRALQLVPATPRQAPLIELASASRSAAVVVAVEGVRVEVASPNETDPGWVAALVRNLQGAGR